MKQGPQVEPLTADQVRSLLGYDHQTGFFFWEKSARGRSKGSRAGSRHKTSGYEYISVAQKKYLSHRLAWLYMTGAWPVRQIDHINGVRHDNRIVNLRDVSNAMNAQNRRPKRLDGLRGITRNGNGFLAQITLNYKRIYLGTFPTALEAHDVYLSAKRKLHAGCVL